MVRIPLSEPHVGTEERRILLEAFDANWVGPLGPYVERLEKEFAAFIGVEAALATSSGTAALHLAMIAAGIGPGDRVVCASLTFAASANPIIYVGAEPVFIDSDRATWQIDPDLLEEELEESVREGRLPKAVVTVDLYGQSADYRRIVPICEKYGVTIIEDAAEALGATCGDKRAGAFGAMSVLSFNGNKIITTGGGGMLLSNDAAKIKHARFLATQARDPAPHYQHSTIGYNYRMSSLCAAFGLGQLAVLPDRIEARRRVFARYADELGDVEGLTFMPEASYGRSNRWLTCIQIDPAEFGATREEVRLALDAEGIESRPLWKPMHLQPVFAEKKMRGGAVSAELFDRGLCLPSGSNLHPDDQQRVIDVVKRVGQTFVSG